MMMFEIAFFSLSFPLLTQAFCDVSTSFPWQPSWMPARDDIYCTSACDQYYGPNFLNSSYNQKDKCCTCNSCTAWDGQLTNLYIEYISVLGKSIVLYDQPFDNNTYYQIELTDDEMTEIPSNLCNWEDMINGTYSTYALEIQPFWNNIVSLDFKGNSIRKILNLNCLQRLDTLILKSNRLQYITNSSMSELAYLRVLDLSENDITQMDTNVLFNLNFNAFIANFSNNQLTTIDISNILLKNPYCELDFSSNLVESVVNTHNFSLDLNQNYGPGLASFQNNLLTTFPDLTKLFNLHHLSDWGKFIESGFDFRGIQLSCDCSLEPFIELGESFRQNMFRDYFNVTCEGPDTLIGRSIVDLQLEDLVCVLDADSDCPRACHCVDQPSSNTLFVNCSNANLKTIPAILPESTLSDYIALDVSGNQITEINLNIPYLNKLASLNLANNQLGSVTNEIADILENSTLDISGNYPLRVLPETFQFRNLCSLYTQNLEIDCSCETLWIESWIQTKHKFCNHDEYFRCKVAGKGIISSKKFRRSLLDCNPEESAFYVVLYCLLIALGILCIGAIIVYTFRLEILVMILRLRQYSINFPICDFSCDVFIIINQEDAKLRIWVLQELRPTLLAKGYRVFLPIIDVLGGEARDSSIALTMENTRNALFILTESYLKEMNVDHVNGVSTENEWKYAWHQMKKDKKKNVVIVNYDHLSSFSVQQSQIKAYLRVGHTVKFGNHDNNVLNRIMAKLGPPPYPKQARQNYDKNPRVKFHGQSKEEKKTEDLDPCFELNIKDAVEKPVLKQCELYMIANDDYYANHASGSETNRNPRFVTERLTPKCAYIEKTFNNNPVTSSSNEESDTGLKVQTGTPKLNGRYMKHKSYHSKVKPNDAYGDAVSLKSCDEIEAMFLTESTV